MLFLLYHSRNKGYESNTFILLRAEPEYDLITLIIFATNVIGEPDLNIIITIHNDKNIIDEGSSLFF